MASIKTYNANNLIGRQFGTATILKELGRGNMAIVFTAFQQTLKRKIAVKLLPKEFLTPETCYRFQQEAEAAAILSHPSIVPIYEIGETEDCLFLCMQLIEGRDLDQVLRNARNHVLPSKRILPLKLTSRIITQILGALDNAHSNDIIHRDIKPANILVEKRTKRPLVSDFGMVKFIRGDQIGEGKVQGSPVFMAPEQITATDVTTRADIYAVGVMLFQMIVPRLPLVEFRSLIKFLNYKKTHKAGVFLKTPSELNPNLNTEMDRIISKATAYDPSHRFESCQAFNSELMRYENKYLNDPHKGD